ncbi:MAG: hypothetical protein Q8927_09380 [Bacteroidota bacterium]|nr:hypothetical protein [Bacteroidota bacterium]
MRQPLLLLLCLAIFQAAAGQKTSQVVSAPVNLPTRPAPDLRISSMTLTHATIPRQTPILNNPNGSQQGSANTSSSNPAVECSIVLNDEFSEQDSIVIELGIPVGATILQLPTNGLLETGSMPVRNALVIASPAHIVIGHMNAGQVMTIQFTFATNTSPVKVWAHAVGKYAEPAWKNNYGQATL